MSEMCRTCAMRAHRSALSGLRARSQTRSFSASCSIQKNATLPTFAETSSPDLDDVLVQLRTKHFIPSYLNKRQRHLIFGDKFTQELANNPAYATLGDEEIPLLHINRRADIPARKPLVLQALNLMQQNDEWKHLPSLLEGLEKSRPGKPDVALQEKILRKLMLADQFPVILRALRRSEATGLSLKNEGVLNQVLLALRGTASAGNWDQEKLQKALRQADEVAELLESEEHGGGRKLRDNDARKRPAVIGLFLELHAKNAVEYQGAQDVNGKVKAYATRFMACFNQANEPPTTDLPQVGPPLEFLSKMSIYHALGLASKVLGPSMPDAARANQIIAAYEARCGELADALRSRGVREGSFAASALADWDACAV